MFVNEVAPAPEFGGSAIHGRVWTARARQFDSRAAARGRGVKPSPIPE